MRANLILLIFLRLISNCNIPIVSGQCSPLRMDFKEIDYTGWTKHDSELIERKEFQKKIHNGCGISKICISSSDNQNCVYGSSCTLSMTYGSTRDKGFNEETEIAMELMGISDVWIAISFAPDPSTKEDAYQLECVKETSGPKLELWESYYDFLEQNVARRQISKANKLARLIDSHSFNGLLYCKFYIKTSFKNTIKYNFKTEAFKPTLSRGNLANFGPTGKLNMDDSCTEVLEWNEKQLIFGQQNTPNLANKNLIRAHATYMIVAFVIFIPIGGFYTRYYKALFKKDISFLELPIWLWVHITCEALAILLMFKGIESIEIAKQGSWATKAHEWSFHQVFGILICTFHVGYFIFFSIFRTKTLKPYRWKFRLVVHQVTGHFMFILTLYLLNTTHWMQFSGMTCLSTLLLRIWTIFYFLMHVVMSLYFTWVHKMRAFGSDWVDPVHEHQLSLFNTLLQPSFQVTNQPLRRFRAYLLIFFVLTTMILAVALDLSLDNTMPFFDCYDKWHYFIV